MKSEFDFYLLLTVENKSDESYFDFDFDIAIIDRDSKKALVISNERNTSTYNSVDCINRNSNRFYCTNYKFKLNKDNSIKGPDLISLFANAYKILMNKCSPFETISSSLYIYGMERFSVRLRRINVGNLSVFKESKSNNGRSDIYNIESIKALFELMQFNLDWVVSKVNDNYVKFSEIKNHYNENLRLASDPRFISHND